MNLRHVIDAFTSTPWAIRAEKLKQIAAVLELRAHGRKLSEGEIAATMGDRPMPPKAPTGVAILSIYGTLVPRADAVDESSGLLSYTRIAGWLDQAMNDDAVGSLILDFDSPGGAVQGAPELAAKFRGYRGVKPMTAVANGEMCSAALWIASQADEIVASPSAILGSIGIIMAHLDQSKADEMEGFSYTILSAGKYKADGNTSHAPASERWVESTQAILNEFYGMITSDIAKGRGVSAADVRNGFGEGGIVTASQAVKLGMADRVATFDQVLAKAAKRTPTRSRASLELFQPAAIITQGAMNALREDAALLAGGSLLAALTQTITTDTIGAVTGDVAPAMQAMPTPAPRFAVGDRVKVSGEPHMPGQSSGTVEIAQVTDVYGIRFDGMDDVHKWYTGEELTPAEDETDEGASASAARIPPTPAPQAKESAMPEAPNGAAPTSGPTNTALAAAQATIARMERYNQLRALAPEYAAEITQAEKAGLDPSAASDTVMQMQRAKHQPLAIVGGPSPSGALPNEAKRPFGSAEYVALLERVESGSLKRTDSRFVRAQDAAAGEFYTAVQVAYSPGGTTDLRLMAAATGMNQGVPAEGGFGVLPQFSNMIWDGLESDPNALLSMTDNYTIDGESLTFLANAETSRATGSRAGGVRGYWINEADQATKSKPTFRTLKLEPQELVVFVYLTDKLIRNNSVGMGQYVNRKAVEEIGFLTGDAIVNGTGTGQPKGILSPGALVTVTKETSQANTTFNKQNANKMWARLHPRSQANAVWLMNIDVSPQLDEFNTPIKNVAGTENVGGFASVIYNAERNTIKGRPIIYNEFCGTLGAVGDVILWDPKGYAAGIRGDGVRTDMSIHVRFEYAESAFRFMYEVDGQPWLAAAQTPKNGSATLTTHVVLSAR